MRRIIFLFIFFALSVSFSGCADALRTEASTEPTSADDGAPLANTVAIQGEFFNRLATLPTIRVTFDAMGFVLNRSDKTVWSAAHIINDIRDKFNYFDHTIRVYPIQNGFSKTTERFRTSTTHNKTPPTFWKHPSYPDIVPKLELAFPYQLDVGSITFLSQNECGYTMRSKVGLTLPDGPLNSAWQGTLKFDIGLSELNKPGKSLKDGSRQFRSVRIDHLDEIQPGYYKIYVPFQGDSPMSLTNVERNFFLPGDSGAPLYLIPPKKSLPIQVFGMVSYISAVNLKAFQLYDSNTAADENAFQQLPDFKKLAEGLDQLVELEVDFVEFLRSYVKSNPPDDNSWMILNAFARVDKAALSAFQ